jgi:nucleoside-diphosphate-sugar epimerase
VTGAPGWLGNKLVKALHERGDKIRCLILPGIDASPIKEYCDEIVEGDVRVKQSLYKATRGVETVFHCVGVIHPKSGKIRDFYEINTQGTKNMLEASLNAKVRKFIHISSCSVQGFNPDRSTLLTEDMPSKPHSHYGKSKKLAEEAINYYHGHYGLPTVILRPTMFYGPGAADRWITLMKMIKDNNLIVFGDGKTLRSSTYIDNLVDACLLADSKENAIGQTYWIADEKPYTWIEIVNEIAEALEVKDFKPIYLPLIGARICEKIDVLLGWLGYYSFKFHVIGEINRDIGVSIEKAKRELGYNPRFSLKEGVRNMVEWCLKRRLI